MIPTRARNSILHRNFLGTTVQLLGPVDAPIIVPSTPLYEAVAALKHIPLGCILVANHGDLVGIFTERDLIKKCALQRNISDASPVSDFMTKSPQCIKSNASIARLLHLMTVGGFRHAPVLGPQPNQLRLASAKLFIDFIYKSVTKKMTGQHEVEILNDNQVDLVFTSMIADLNPSKPLVVGPDEPIVAALQKLVTSSVGSVIVSDSQTHKLLGIFTERDYLIKVAFNRKIDLEKNKVREFMTAEPRTALDTSSIALAFNLMSEGGYRHLPIVDELEQLIGVVSIKNFFELLTVSILSELN